MIALRKNVVSGGFRQGTD